MAKTSALPTPPETPTSSPSPATNGVSVSNLPTVFHTPPSPLRAATSPLEARLDELRNGDVGELRTHRPDGSFGFVPAIVKRQVGDQVDLVFANGAEDTAPRSDIRAMKSFPDGHGSLFGEWFRLVAPRLDASTFAGLYATLRGPVGTAAWQPVSNANVVSALFGHVRNLNIAERQAEARAAAAQK